VTTATSDGRVLRGERNRTAIVDALLALLAEGESRPSARLVAERAGVSLRSVFQHFDDMESLYAACVERQLGRVAQLVTPIEPQLPLDTRVAAIVDQRVRLFEQVAPIRRAALLAAPASPVLRAGLRRSSDELRDQVAKVFAPELTTRGREVLDALDVACSFDAWDHLSRTRGLRAAAVRRAMTRLVRGALGEGSP